MQPLAGFLFVLYVTRGSAAMRLLPWHFYNGLIEAQNSSGILLDKVQFGEFLEALDSEIPRNLFYGFSQRGRAVKLFLHQAAAGQAKIIHGLVHAA